MWASYSWTPGPTARPPSSYSIPSTTPSTSTHPVYPTILLLFVSASPAIVPSIVFWPATAGAETVVRRVPGVAGGPDVVGTPPRPRVRVQPSAPTAKRVADVSKEAACRVCPYRVSFIVDPFLIACTPPRRRTRTPPCPPRAGRIAPLYCSVQADVGSWVPTSVTDPL